MIAPPADRGRAGDAVLLDGDLAGRLQREARAAGRIDFRRLQRQIAGDRERADIAIARGFDVGCRSAGSHRR